MIKASTKLFTASGYLMLAGLVISLVGYMPAEILGNMICGAGFMLLIEAAHQLIKETNSPDSE